MVIQSLQIGADKMARQVYAPPVEEQFGDEAPQFLHNLTKWTEAKKWLGYYKQEESETRRSLADQITMHQTEGEVKPGTYHIGLPNNWKATATQKLSYKVDEAALASVKDQLPPGTLDRCIKYKPELSISEYKKLTDEQKKILDQALIIKPGMPELKLVEPK